MSLSNLLRFIVVLIAVLLSSTSRAQDAAIKAKTKQHFEAGLAHIDDPAGPRYEEAYREFHAAYAETPALSIAGNIGTCALYLERDAEAIEMYELFLSKAKPNEISKKKREQMQKDVQALRAGLVRISIKTEPDNGVLVDQRFTASGTTVANRYPVVRGVASLGIHPGNHKITFEADGHEPQSWVFEAAPASEHRRELRLEPVEKIKVQPTIQSTPDVGSLPKERSVSSNRKQPSALVYVGAAVTGALGLGAIGMGIVARSKNSEYERVNDGEHAEQASSLRGDIGKYLLAADVLAGAAVLSGGITLYLYLSANSPKRASTTASPTAWRVSPVLGSERAVLTFKGSF